VLLLPSRPSIAVSLELQPGGRGKPAREGTLKINVSNRVKVVLKEQQVSDTAVN
jgi:hypothetical protein